MKHYLQDRGIQSSITTGVMIGALASITDGYRPVWAVFGVVWAAATVMAVLFARRKVVN